MKMHSSRPYYFSQLQLSSILEMPSNSIMMLYQLSGTEHPSFNIKTQLGGALWSSSLAEATAGTFVAILLEKYGVRALIKP